MFTLALIQMLVEGGEARRNRARAVARIAEAAAHGADVVLLPEALDLGWTHPAARAAAGAVPDGDTCRALADAARRHRVLVCAGLVERDGDGVFNTAVLLDADGRLRLRHRKLNELEIGHPFYDQGDRLNVCPTRFGTFGLLVCADAFARDRVLSRALGYMGADVLLSPCSWAVVAGHDNTRDPYGGTWRNAYGPVAREFQLWIAGCSNVGPIAAGPWAGMRCIGCSLVVGPGGEEVVQGPYGESAEEILYVGVEPRPRPARGCGWGRVWDGDGAPRV